MKRLSFFILGFLFAVTTRAQTTVAGSTPGSFRVTESGAAEYRIPIQVPPGIAGMEPKLALVYNSQAGNGLLGVGWSLEGLSSITRCPRTVAQDGLRGGVNYDWNDRYCLDGQRLMMISGAFYGADGAEYRAERESFSKVISYGVAGNGPAWFKVWTKGGQILEYGNTADSRIEAQGKPTVRVWGVNKVTDIKGNHFTVTYIKDSANGDFYPARLAYTGSTGSTGVPANSVQLEYEARSDVTTFYRAGSGVSTPVRLSRMKIYAGQSLIRDYRLAYDGNGAGGRSRLLRLTECAADASCLSPIEIGWLSNNGSGAFSLPVFTYPAGWNFGTDLNVWQTITGDFNGDGKTDFARIHPNYLHLFLSNGDGTYSLPVFWYPEGWNFGTDLNVWQTITGDFNGDGKTDFARIHPNYLHLFLSNGDGTFSLPVFWYPEGWNFGTDLNVWQTITGDFNGDGRTDFARVGPTYLHLFLSNGDGTFTTPVFWYPDGWNFGTDRNVWQTITGDFNGDGKTDFARVGPTYVHMFLSNGDGTFSTPVFSYPDGWNFGTDLNAWQTITGDFNGDGLTDFAHIHGTYLHMFLSKGDGTFELPIFWYPAGWNFGSDLTVWQTVTGDFNGDGKTDFARIHPNYLHLFLSNGDGTFSLPVFWYPGGWNFGTDLNVWQTITGDFNGDGLTDFARIHPTYLHDFFALGSAPDLVSSVTTGSGATLDVVYRPLTDGSVYAKGSGAAYPQVDLHAPVYVVSSTSQSDGVGGNRTSTFGYGDLRASMDGRGSLGFRWLETRDGQTGLKLRTEYRQDWPYAGLPSLVTKSPGSGALLSERIDSHGCTNPSTGGTCTVAPGNRYFPFLFRSVETRVDLNGAALSTTTTSTQYDSVGNATSVVVSTGDGHGKTTTNIYTNDTANWRLGRLTRSTVQSSAP